MTAFSFFLSFISAKFSAETKSLMTDKTTKNELVEGQIFLIRLA